MAKDASCHIGTSGWDYKHWNGVFYPENHSPKENLSFFSSHFDTVEINNSFYRLPDVQTIENWRDTVPEDFLFAVKASRYITHMKKLNDPKKSVSKFLKTVSHLNKKLGPILFQLPPNWRKNAERLISFLEVLPEKHRYTFEFRDKSWFSEDIYSSLSDHNTAFCIYDMNGDVSPEIITADFIYVRLHGPGKIYEGKYSKHQLNPWAKRFRDWMEQGKEVFCYFNNDLKGNAVKNAKTLQRIMNS